MARTSILLAEDERNQREIYQLMLEDDGYHVTPASSGEYALKLAREQDFDLVLTDYKMTGMDGLTLLGELLKKDPSLIVVMMTAHGSLEAVKEALRRGAFDYLEKPVDRDQLLRVVESALGRLNRIDDEIIGESEEMERVKKMVLKVAGSSSTVLIRGESGVGKEHVARAIHKASRRASEIFQAVHCTAINTNLLESELFGHEKGSITGVHTQKKGPFEVADKGTLFLDEIGDLGISMQAKLLGVLQEKEIMRVGGTRPVRVDVRVIAATNRDLEAMVKDGRFREDLYYRMNVIPITIPPLLNRRSDILPLIHYFITKHSASEHRVIRDLTPSARNFLLNYAWPGNVRQVESVIERAILLCEGNEIDLQDLQVESFQAMIKSNIGLSKKKKTSEHQSKQLKKMSRSSHKSSGERPRSFIKAVSSAGFSIPKTKKVFIVHGHDERNLLRLQRLLRDRFHLEPIVLADQPGRGRTLIKKFEDEAESCSFAFVLLTPDDQVATPKGEYTQARPNVVFELGWFFARLGRSRVLLLLKPGTKIHSDLDGVSRIEFNENIEEKFLELEAELKEAGLL